MLELFKIEWLKIKSYRAFWILFLVFVILYPLGFYFTAYKYFDLTGNDVQAKMVTSVLMPDIPFMFPRVWEVASWAGGMFFILIGMLFVLLVTNEMQYRTHRQNIIDGWSRMDFLKAKFSLVLFFVLVSTVLVFVTALLTGLTYSTSTANILTGLEYVGYYALLSLLYLMFAFMISILVKRTGLAIILYFAAVVIVDNILWLILSARGYQIAYFLPLESGDSLLPNPMIPKLLSRRTVPDYSLIISSVVYIAIYTYVVVTYFRKSDLKT